MRTSSQVLYIHANNNENYVRTLRNFENIKSKDKPVLNNANSKDSPSSGDYPESVVLESPAKPSLGCRTGSPSLVWHEIGLFVLVIHQ